MRKAYMFFLCLCFTLVITVSCGNNIKPDKNQPKSKPTLKNPGSAESSNQIKTEPTKENIQQSPDSRDYRKDNPLPSPLSEKQVNELSPECRKYYERYASTVLMNSERNEHLKPLEVISKMGLKPGDTIADIGCGSGFFTFRFSRVVGEKGKVYAVDIHHVPLDIIRKFIVAEKERTGEKFDNIDFVESEKDEVKLPDKSLDYAFLSEVDMYTYTIYNTEDSSRVRGPGKAYKIILKGTQGFTASIKRALKDDGKLIVINKKKQYHEQGDQWEEGTIRVLENSGFKLEKKYPILPRHYFLVFKKA